MISQKEITIVTPTYNSMNTLNEYMEAIIKQDYPHEKINVIFVDGGSSDGTLECIESYRNTADFSIDVYNNQLVTAEAGKAIGVKKAKSEIICLLDSDNIIPSTNWLSLMTEPFNEDIIICSEPIEYTYRRSDNIVNRYCALIGMNDPLCLFTKNYDRYCTITNKWTEIDREEIDKGNYLSIKFNNGIIPTIGANGFCIRKQELLKHIDGDYLFDIDILYELLNDNPCLRVAKVKTGVIHLFCPNVKTFIRKQNRRIKDYLYFNDSNIRKYPWSKIPKTRIVLFILSCISIVPLLIQTIIGNSRKQDIKAWTFHMIACWITLLVYGCGTISGLFNRKIANRNDWNK